MSPDIWKFKKITKRDCYFTRERYFYQLQEFSLSQRAEAFTNFNIFSMSILYLTYQIVFSLYSIFWASIQFIYYIPPCFGLVHLVSFCLEIFSTFKEVAFYKDFGGSSSPFFNG